MPYFTPSSANSCPRELYEKLRKSKKDTQETPPHKGRWQSIGTAIGDAIQRELLFAEKHLPGNRFSFERNERGEPMFENFAKINQTITHNGQTFALFGLCDGIMRYVSESGEIVRVGLEIKSKQTSYSATSEFSQRNGPKDDHVKQTVCYSIMYGPLDYYIILYVNASKKAWEMSAEDYAKSPDIAVHCVRITDGDRTVILDRFAGIAKAAAEGASPPLDITRWTFNNFKAACAVGLSADELAQIERQVDAVQRSSLKDFVKRQYVAALADIKRLRGEAESYGTETKE